MRKKKVLSFYGFLALFALGLAAFNVLNFGSLTGKVVSGEDYQESLFLGKDYQFKYYPSYFNLNMDSAEVRGQLKEMAGTDHELQITGYAFTRNGEVCGVISNEVFLGAKSDLTLNVRIPSDSQAERILIYIEDQETSIRISKEFVVSNLPLTGNAINEGNDFEQYGSFFLGFLIFGSLISFVIYKVRENKKNLNLHNALHQKHQRRYIDLDVR
ncbi:MAG TPA: hypothetical protein VHA12_02585 [Candidatus Nanoarchaeia archaeon]|nr:hypothetical protein [Candidatus Nanoarchaeia archaeon]